MSTNWGVLLRGQHHSVPISVSFCFKAARCGTWAALEQAGGPGIGHKMGDSFPLVSLNRPKKGSLNKQDARKGSANLCRAGLSVSCLEMVAQGSPKRVRGSDPRGSICTAGNIVC